MQYHTLVVSKLARPQTMFPIALCTYLILKQEIVKYEILLLTKACTINITIHGKKPIYGANKLIIASIIIMATIMNSNQTYITTHVLTCIF